MNIINKTEGNIQYEVYPVGDMVRLDVENIKTGKNERRTYKCIYKPVCGYDALDVQNVENELDAMIALVKGE